jgi:predicted  nucleic acid-binding Zn-ribbon protein
MFDATPETTVLVVASILQLLTAIGGVIIVMNWYKKRENEKVEEVTKQTAIDEEQNRKIAVLESRVDNLDKSHDSVSKQLDKVDMKIDNMNRLLVDFFTRGTRNK